MKRVVLVLIAAVALLGVTTAFGEDAAALYKSKCASCHGADGSGQTTIGKSMKLKDLRSEEVQKSDIKAVIADGKGKMPAYKAKLSAAEIDGLVAHIKSLKK